MTPPPLHPTGNHQIPDIKIFEVLPLLLSMGLNVGQGGVRLEDISPLCHDFRRFPTFLCLSPKRPHSFTQPMTRFPFPFPHNLYLIFYPTSYLIFLFGHFGYQGQVRSIQFTRRLVSLGLPKEFYLLGSHRPFKPHCVHVGDCPLDLLRRGHLRGIQDLGQG